MPSLVQFLLGRRLGLTVAGWRRLSLLQLLLLLDVPLLHLLGLLLMHPFHLLRSCFISLLLRHTLVLLLLLLLELLMFLLLLRV